MIRGIVDNLIEDILRNIIFGDSPLVLPALSSGTYYGIFSAGQSNSYTGGTNLIFPAFGYVGNYAEQNTITQVKKATSGAAFADMKLGTTWSGTIGMTRSGDVGTITHAGAMTSKWAQVWPSTDSLTNPIHVDTNTFTIDTAAGGVFSDPAGLFFANRMARVTFSTSGVVSCTFSGVSEASGTITVNVDGTPFPALTESITRIELLSIPLFKTGANEPEFNGAFEGYNNATSGQTLVKMADSGPTTATGTQSLILGGTFGEWIHLAKNTSYSATTPVYLSLNGQGGTDLLNLLPGEGSTHGNDVQTELVNSYNAATAAGDIVPNIIVRHGEDNASASKYAEHPKLMKIWRKYLMHLMEPALTGTPHFLMGELLKSARVLANNSYHGDINAGLATLVDAAARIHLIPSDGCVDYGDYVHFDGNSQVLMGQRFFEKIASLTHDAVLSGSTYGPNLLLNGALFHSMNGFVIESGLSSLTLEPLTDQDFTDTGEQFLNKIVATASSATAARYGTSNAYKPAITSGEVHKIECWAKLTGGGSGTIYLDKFTNQGPTSNGNWPITSDGVWRKVIDGEYTANVTGSGSTGLNWRGYPCAPGAGQVGNVLEVCFMSTRLK